MPKKNLCPSIRKKAVVLLATLKGARNKWLMRTRGYVIKNIRYSTYKITFVIFVVFD